MRTAIVTVALLVAACSPASAGPVAQRLPVCEHPTGVGQPRCVVVGERGDQDGSYVVRTSPAGVTTVRIIHRWRARNLTAVWARDPR